MRPVTLRAVQTVTAARKIWVTDDQTDMDLEADTATATATERRRLSGQAYRHYPVGSSSTSAAVAFERIAVDPDRLGGVRCIRDLRFPVATVVAMVADGVTNDEILAELPDLDAEDIAQSLRYAALAA